MAEKAEKQNKKAPAPKAPAKAKAPASKRTAKAPAKPESKQAEKQLVKAHARGLKLAPRKMRLVTNLVKGMRVADALTQLQFTNKKGAKMLIKLLMSATANAEHNFSMNRDNLFIKTITCDMGQVLQRSFPRARGSAFVIRRKMSHVNVVLEERAVKGKRTKAVIPKVAKKEATPKANLDDGIASEIPDAKVKETHHENDRTLVDQKTSPENQNK
jgi:large subunit ribosomal protein L22